MDARPVRRALRLIVRIAIGPWPIYPRAIVLIAVFTLFVRGATRILSQPVGAEPALVMVFRIGWTSLVVALVAWVAARMVPRAVGRVTGVLPRGGYLTALLVISLLTSGVLIGLRIVVPDGGVDSRLPIPVILLTTLVVTFIAVFATNGLMGYTLDRLRRQEEEVRAERSLLLASEERVRADTAHFLHDAMQSTLLRATMRLAMLEREDLPPDVHQRLRVVIDELDDVREDGIRGAGRRLSPPLSSTGLIVAIGELAETYDGTMAITSSFDEVAAERFRRVGQDDRVALAVYRIVEQGLQNALKHGEAASVRLEIEAATGPIVVRVIDDGRGVGRQPVPGSGTAVISAWVDDVGGAWEMRPGRGGGTVLEARLRV